MGGPSFTSLSSGGEPSIHPVQLQFSIRPVEPAGPFVGVEKTIRREASPIDRGDGEKTMTFPLDPPAVVVISAWND